MRKVLSGFALVALLLVVPAGATVVIGLQQSNLWMPTVNYFGPGPQFGPNYTWTSTNATYQGGSVFGYNGGYGFGANGYWYGMTMAGLNDSFAVYGVTDTMTFTFTNPVLWTGGFFNYVPFSGDPTTLAVWDVSNNLIESYDLTFLTNGGLNQGEWIVFQESTAIKYFTMTGNYVGVATPEPGTMLLVGSGALGLAGFIRRRLF